MTNEELDEFEARAKSESYISMRDILDLIALARVGLAAELVRPDREAAIIALDEYYEAGGTRLADLISALPKPGGK